MLPVGNGDFDMKTSDVPASADFVSVSDEPIDSTQLYKRAERPDAGAVVQFCGTVRNHSEGARVVELRYEAYTEMAVSEIGKIIAVARKSWPILHASAVHRTGDLPIGDLAVCVTVSSAHREAAFAACRYIIDELKRRAPIWKHETLASGAARWVNAAGEAPQPQKAAKKGLAATS